MKLGFAVPLGAVFLLTVGCGSPSQVVLSGVGEARDTINLDSGSYTVAWSEPDKDFTTFCQSSADPADHLTIAVSLTYDIGSTDQPTGQTTFNAGGGTYQCHISANSGSAWKITFTH